MLTVRQAAGRSGQSVRTVKDWLSNGEIAYDIDAEGRELIRPEDLDRLLTKRAGPTGSVTVRELAERENTTVQAVYYWVNSKGLPCVIGNDGKMFISLSDFSEWRKLNPPNSEGWLTFKEVSRRYAVSLPTLYSWVASGRMAVVAGSKFPYLVTVEEAERAVNAKNRRGLRCATE